MNKDNIFSEIKNLVDKISWLAYSQCLFGNKSIQMDHDYLTLEWIALNMRMLHILKFLKQYRMKVIKKEENPVLNNDDIQELLRVLYPIKQDIINNKANCNWTEPSVERYYLNWLKNPLSYDDSTPAVLSFFYDANKFGNHIFNNIEFQESCNTNVDPEPKTKLELKYDKDDHYYKKMPAAYIKLNKAIDSFQIKGVKFETKRLFILITKEILGFAQDIIIGDKYKKIKINDKYNQTDINTINSYYLILKEPSSNTPESIFTYECKKEKIKEATKSVFEEYSKEPKYKDYYLIQALIDLHCFKNVEIAPIVDVLQEWQVIKPTRTQKIDSIKRKITTQRTKYSNGSDDKAEKFIEEMKSSLKEKEL